MHQEQYGRYEIEDSDRSRGDECERVFDNPERRRGRSGSRGPRRAHLQKRERCAQ
jgi:hypothetical protein